MIEEIMDGITKWGCSLLVVLWFILVTLAAARVLLGWP